MIENRRPSSEHRIRRSKALLALLAGGMLSSEEPRVSNDMPSEVSNLTIEVDSLPISIIEPSLPEQYKYLAEQDAEAIAVRNRERTKNKERSKPELDEAKRVLRDKLANCEYVSYADVNFLTMELLDQGVEPEIVGLALGILDEKVRILKKHLPKVPNKYALEEFYKTFHRPGTYERTRSVASDALICDLCAHSLNCEAAEKIDASAWQLIYPDFANAVYHQEFADHVQTIIEIQGKKHVLKDGLSLLDDDLETRQVNNIVMPYTSYLRLYAGEEIAQVENIIAYGPKEKDLSKPYLVHTDSLVTQDWRNEFQLGNFSSPDKIYEVQTTDTTVTTQLSVEDRMKKNTLEYLATLTQLNQTDALLLLKYHDVTEQLHLEKIQTISIEVAKELAMFKGPILLDGLNELTPDVMSELAKHRSWLSLSGLKELTPELAHAIAQYKGFGVFLDGVKFLTPEIAKELGKTSAVWILLDGLTELDITTANELVQSDSNLSLNGLTTLSLDVAKELVKMQRIVISDHNDLIKPILSLKSLSKLDDDVAAEFAKAQYLTVKIKE